VTLGDITADKVTRSGWSWVIIALFYRDFASLNYFQHLGINGNTISSVPMDTYELYTVVHISNTIVY